MHEAWKPLEGQSVIGEFELRSCLASTEESAVFSAAPVEDDSKTIAVRLVASDSPTAARRRTQWDLASRLSHPHLVRIDRTGACELNGARYVWAVMEHADEVLAEVLPHRALTPAETRQMLGPVLEALAYLHENKLVHGRLKPSNIMSVDERLRVSSDGIYRAGEAMADQPAGPYTAPEQATGAAPSVDVWALGVTLVEVLTRQPSTQPAGLPAPFGEIAANCLEPDPAKRWTVQQIGARLGHSFALPARAAGFGTSSNSMLRKLALPVAAVGVAAALLIFSPSLPQPAPEEDPPQAVAAVDPEPEAAPPPAPEPEPEPPPPPPEPEPEPEPEEPAPEPESEQQPETEPEPPPPPEQPFTPEAGDAPPGVTRQVMPTVLQSALDTITGTVRVTVTAIVDARGELAATIMEDAGPSEYFARASQDAAGQWEFEASEDASGAATQWRLRFEYTPAGVQVFAERPGQ